MPLFKTNDELKLYFPARMTLNMNDIAQTMDRIENDYLADQVLGSEQYQELVTAYEAEAIVTGDRLDKLLHRCRAVSAHLVAYHYADLGALQWTSTGFVVATGNTGEGAAAVNRIDRFKRELLTAGFSFMDRLLGFLQAGISDYPLWEASPFRLRAQGLLRSTSQFQAVCNIGNSHWFYWQLRTLIERNQDEDSLIANTLCSADLYAELVSQSNAGDTFSAPNAKLIAAIRPAIAHLCIAEGVTDGSIGKDDRGYWTFMSFSGSGGGPVGATDQRLETWKKYHQARADEYVALLGKKLKALADASQLPLYAASPCYTQDVADETPTPPDPTRMVGNFM
jgi:hypothetical protein